MLMQSDVSVERLRGAQFRRATEAGTGRNARPRESVTITNEAALLELTGAGGYITGARNSTTAVTLTMRSSGTTR